MSDLKSYIITLKESANDSDKSQIKNKIQSLGGNITSEFSLINGFVAKLPSGQSASINEYDHVEHIEEDKEVKIQ